MTTSEFNKVIIPLKDSIFRYALSILGNEMDAEDMLQDTYSKLWSMRESLDKFENLDAYVLRMVRNMCIDKLRRERLHEDKLEDAFVDNGEFVSGQGEDLRDMEAIVKKLISQLPEKARTVIHLRDVEGYEMEEIADIVGDDVATLRVTLSRARKTIRERTIKIMNYGL